MAALCPVGFISPFGEPICGSLSLEKAGSSTWWETAREPFSAGILRQRGGGGGAGRALARRDYRIRSQSSDTQTVASVQTTKERRVDCDACQGLGFRICDYCEGEKVNVPVKDRPNRFHRRCPECRAVGIMMCYRCKVFKCVTFPDWDDGSLEQER